MRRKVMVALCAFMAAVMINSLSFAEDVYVTKYGKKYHKEGSRFIKGKDVEKLDRAEAEALGYKPSSDFKDESQEKGADSEEK